MTDRFDDEGAGRARGWYPDPWQPGFYRLWTGESWTSDVFPAGYAPPGDDAAQTRPLGPPPARRSTVPPPPPQWHYLSATPPPLPPGEVLDSADGRSRRRVPPRWAVAALAVVIGASAGLAGDWWLEGRSSTSAAGTPAVTPSPSAVTPSTAPPSSAPQSTDPRSNQPSPSASAPSRGSFGADPAAAVLGDLVVQQKDVGSAYRVGLLDGGNTVSGAATLDLCNAGYPSEALRRARLQVAAVGATGQFGLSTEAVRYQTAAATAQAFRELQSVAKNCPNRPVQSPVGEPTALTRFGTAPDAGWPQVAGVQRLAFDLTVTDQSGDVNHTVAVYLRRGPLLLGVYFASADNVQQIGVDGQHTLSGITTVFAKRLAAVPAAQVNG